MSLVFCVFDYAGEAERLSEYERLITEMQDNDTENTYLSPLSIAGAREDALCEADFAKCEKELFESCDSVFVLGQPTEAVKRRIERADALRMPVIFHTDIENSRVYRL